MLHSFRANLTSDPGALDSWLPGSNPCGAGRQWAGVMCDGTGAVIGVALDGQGLRGPLDGGLARLATLQQIHLARNQLTGGRESVTRELPSQGWGTRCLLLPVARTLCSQHAPRPYSSPLLSSCPPFDKPCAAPSPAFHHHAGTLPDEWAALVNVTAIDVSSNNLTGPLPDSWGPALTGLQRFDASGNGALNGTLPAAWSRMASLQVL